MSVTHSIPAPAPAPPTPPAEDPFRYGWRFVRRVGPDGRVELEEVPLTLEDVLHPQEGDVIPENSLQARERLKWGERARVGGRWDRPAW